MAGPVETVVNAFAGQGLFVQALLGGLVIAGMNLLGASLVLVWRDPSERALDGALGFAAGVMLAASFTSLILPGIEATPGGARFPSSLASCWGRSRSTAPTSSFPTSTTS